MPSKAALRLDGQVDRGVGRGQEPDEGQADLGDGQEAAGLGDQALDPRRAAVALVDELVDPGPAHRDEGDLGGHEDAFEEGQDHDHEQLDERVHLAGRVLGRFLARLADAGRHADRELAGRHVVGHDRAGSGPRALADA